jgi:hypothetical protein
MNLFVLGWSPLQPIDSAKAEGALSRLVEELPFFSSGDVRTWRAPSGSAFVACVSHGEQETGGVEYAWFERNRMAFFSGRPYLWGDDLEADGRTPLDPRIYLESAESWCQKLDGRWVVARYDETGGTLEICTDALGAYHVFTARERRTQWFSNNVALLRALVGARTLNPLVPASLVACGFSLGGTPLWEEVRRLPRGTLHRFRRETAEETSELLPTPAISGLIERRFDADAAAKTLVSAVRALSDWPSRPILVPLSGGKDSRLVFAAALNAGIAFEPHVMADTETPDVQAARLVAESVGRSLRVLASRRNVSIMESARILRLTAPGMLSLDLARSALNRPGQSTTQGSETVPLAIIHTGHGGELAKAHYGVGGRLGGDFLARGLYRQATTILPKPPLSREGRHLVKEHLRRWVRNQLGFGVPPSHLPELFYLVDRESSWVGASHGFDEYMADLTSPLWSPRLLPHLYGLPASDRARELFHFHLLSVLAPGLERLPFAGLPPVWPTDQESHTVAPRLPVQPRRRRFRVLTYNMSRELRRRYALLRSPRAGAEDRDELLTEAAAIALEHVPVEPGHELWQMLDRRRTLDLLRRDPSSLDARSKRILWRLATVFLVCMD